MAAVLTPGTAVRLRDGGPEHDLTGTVQVPTAADVSAGRRQLGPDLDDCILIRWDTGITRWEYRDDLTEAVPAMAA